MSVSLRLRIFNYLDFLEIHMLSTGHAEFFITKNCRQF